MRNTFDAISDQHLQLAHLELAVLIQTEISIKIQLHIQYFALLIYLCHACHARNLKETYQVHGLAQLRMRRDVFVLR